jgi:hypothetical protein
MDYYGHLLGWSNGPPTSPTTGDPRTRPTNLTCQYHLTWQPYDKGLYTSENRFVLYRTVDQNTTPAMEDRRVKSEQFQKTRNNWFKRGFKIGYTSKAELWVVIKRKGKFYTMTNTDNLLPS